MQEASPQDGTRLQINVYSVHWQYMSVGAMRHPPKCSIMRVGTETRPIVVIGIIAYGETAISGEVYLSRAK